jgi:hypothetical protein
MNLAWPTVPDGDAHRYPYYATSRSATGETTVVPFQALEIEPAANPWRVYAVVLADHACGRAGAGRPAPTTPVGPRAA